MPFHKNSLKISAEQGFTLLEVLIAILIFAIGLLALAGLQLQSLRYSHSAGMRTIATNQAATLADLVRSNREGLKNGYYNNSGNAAVNDACFSSAGCTVQQMANLDLALWNQSVAQVLPNGVGVICVDSTPVDGISATDAACDNVAGAPYVIKIWWTDDRSGESTDTTRFVTSFQP
jgi:type IV pilus assembly protein PilV